MTRRDAEKINLGDTVYIKGDDCKYFITNITWCPPRYNKGTKIESESFRFGIVKGAERNKPCPNVVFVSHKDIARKSL